MGRTIHGIVRSTASLGLRGGPRLDKSRLGAALPSASATASIRSEMHVRRSDPTKVESVVAQHPEAHGLIRQRRSGMEPFGSKRDLRN